MFIEYLESKKEYFGELHYKDVLPNSCSKIENLPPPPPSTTANICSESDIKVEKDIEIKSSERTTARGNEMEIKIE